MGKGNLEDGIFGLREDAESKQGVGVVSGNTGTNEPMLWYGICQYLGVPPVGFSLFLEQTSLAVRDY